MEQWQSELVDAFHWGDQERARTLVVALREARPTRVQSVLEQMLQSPAFTAEGYAATTTAG